MSADSVSVSLSVWSESCRNGHGTEGPKPTSLDPACIAGLLLSGTRRTAAYKVDGYRFHIHQALLAVTQPKLVADFVGHVLGVGEIRVVLQEFPFPILNRTSFFHLGIDNPKSVLLVEVALFFQKSPIGIHHDPVIVSRLEGNLKLDRRRIRIGAEDDRSIPLLGIPRLSTSSG